ncbi:transposase (plasmid) [Sinorhizobium medicae]|nr:transposase [Sinorhizobium medicae]UFX05459.1 transposase [Sinorhizobium medicae WSM1115]WQO62475.1 transposase [Sinorhizobium medicae]WQO88959.1 transposase [Sinorhizobium medicae]
MMEEGQKLVVRLVGRDGRRRFDPESKDRLIAACLEPGASVSKLALEHGVNANLVWKWIRKHTRAPPFPPSSTSAFLPVQITAASSKSALEMPATDGEETSAAVMRLSRRSMELACETWLAFTLSQVAPPTL